MIDSIHESTGYGIRPICKTLNVPRSSYYHAAEPSPTLRSDKRIGDTIKVIFKSNRRRYGYRRIWEDLSDRGIVCAASRVRRIMKEEGLQAIQPKTFVPQTSDGRADKPSPNLILNEPIPAKPSQVWAGDITYIPTSTGWLYLAVVIDLCTRRIVGWSIANHMRSQMVIDALSQALRKARPAPGLIFHSDRGSQYGSGAFRQLLAQFEIRQSMSAPANPYHNAWTESFIGTLKTEMLQGGCFINEQDARTEIFYYIESYYNNHRKHSALNYQTPAQFEAAILSLN